MSGEPENVDALRAALQDQADNYNMRVDLLPVVGQVRVKATHKQLVGMEHTVFIPLNVVLRVAGAALSSIDVGAGQTAVVTA